MPEGPSRRSPNPGPGQPGARSTELPRLLPTWRDALDDSSVSGRLRLLARLRRALRTERQRAAAGHWAYDPARHAHLLAAYRSEALAVAALPRAPSPPGSEIKK